MKTTRRDALKILNACFKVENIDNAGYILSGSAPKLQHNFLIGRLQLFNAILLRQNNTIWQLFCSDLVEFEKKYQNLDKFLESSSNALSDFFKKDSNLFSSEKLHKKDDSENKLPIDSVTEVNTQFENKNKNIIPTIAPFYDFWNLCCDIENIPKSKRDSNEYNFAKIDAFFYFNALKEFYGERFNHLKKDLIDAGIEIHSLNEIVGPRDAEYNHRFEEICDFGVESPFFKCPLFTKILVKSVFWANLSPDKDFEWGYGIYTSMLFSPTSKIVQHITTTILIELTKALNTINSDKDFWGNDWANDDTENRVFSNDEINRISNKIVEDSISQFNSFMKAKESTNMLPPIPIFEKAVKGGYFAAQDSEGHYRTIQSLSHCIKYNSELLALTPTTLKEYMRKPDGSEYSDRTIENAMFT